MFSLMFSILAMIVVDNIIQILLSLILKGTSNICCMFGDCFNSVPKFCCLGSEYQYLVDYQKEGESPDMIGIVETTKRVQPV